MSLVIETGEGLADADSVVTLEEVRAFAGSRGATLTTDDPTLEQQVRRAHDYLAYLEPQFQGCRTTVGQSLPFPRAGMIIQNRCYDKNTIPVAVKNAACQLVIEQLTTPDLSPAKEGRVIQSETVGPLSTTYIVNSDAPSFPKVLTFLALVLNYQGSAFLHSVRV